ncbi:hypothetical protein D3C75_1220670 [compost metagenome]
MLDRRGFAYSCHTHNDNVGICAIAAALPWVNDNEAAAGVFSQIITGTIIKSRASKGETADKGTHWHDFI